MSSFSEIPLVDNMNLNIVDNEYYIRDRENIAGKAVRIKEMKQF